MDNQSVSDHDFITESERGLNHSLRRRKPSLVPVDLRIQCRQRIDAEHLAQLEQIREHVGDLVRDAVRLVMQELIETEAAEQIGAARYERINTPVTERNGSRPRLMATAPATTESPR